MRRPVRSHVANRKMFQGGGLSPLPQPTGILASSQPLVDQVVQNIVNPNRTMPMNQGGFAHGGLTPHPYSGNRGPSPNSGTIATINLNKVFNPWPELASGERPTYDVDENWKGKGPNYRLDNTYYTNMGFRDFVSKNYPDTTVPSFTFKGKYAPVKGFTVRPKTPEESIYKLVNETLDQSTIRMGFNRSGETFEEHYPVVEDALVAGEPYSNVGTAIRKQFSELYNITVPLRNLAMGVWDTFAYNFSTARGPNATNYVPDYKDVELFKVVMRMGREREDLAPQIEKAAKEIISENPKIEPIDLQHEIVRTLTEIEKFGTHGGDGVTKVIAEYVQASLVDPLHPPPDPGTEAERLQEEAREPETEAERLQEEVQDPESIAKMMAALNAPPGDPGSRVGEEEIVIASKQRISLGTRLLHEQQQRKRLESLGRGDEYVMSEEMKRFQDQQKKGRDPTIDPGALIQDKTKKQAADDPEKQAAADGTGPLNAVEAAAALLKSVTEQNNDSPSNQNDRIALETQFGALVQDSKVGNTKDMEARVKELMEVYANVMPKFQGKTADEKAYDMIKLGLSIAAGTSPNAIENISKGTLAVIDTFSIDDKAKRIFEMQTQASLAKVAISQVQSELAFDRETAYKEGIPMTGMVKRGFTLDGRTYQHGDWFPYTVKMWRDGIFKKINEAGGALTTEDLYGELLDNAAAASTAAIDSFKNLKVKPTDKQLIGDRDKYNASMKQIQSYMTIKALLSEGMGMMNKKQVLGVKPWFQSMINKGLNAIGVDATGDIEYKYINDKGVEITENYTAAERAGVLSKLASEKKELYDSRQQAIIALSIRALLQETNRTISDNDRRRADDIAGRITTMLGGWTGDPTVNLEKLKRFYDMIDSDMSKEGRQLAAIERQWQQALTPASVWGQKDTWQTWRDFQFVPMRRSAFGEQAYAVYTGEDDTVQEISQNWDMEYNKETDTFKLVMRK